MVRTDTTLVRLARESRKSATQRSVRVPFRHRKKRATIKLTPSQKAANKEKRDQEKAEIDASLNAAREALWVHAESLAERFGAHGPEHYYRAIMQQPILKRKRGVSRWNAFLSAKVKQHNEGTPWHANRARVSGDIIKTISAEWREMSEEEREAATSDLVADLEERRANQATAAHNVPLASFQDACRAIARVENELVNLCARTGMQVLLVAVRSATTDYNKPHVFYTDNRIPDFIQTAMGEPIQEVALRMEAYCIAGMPREACTRGDVQRMNYANFEESITAKLGILCEGWPIKRFCSPSDMSSPADLEVLKSAWESG
ncbi:hypothetical protein FKP32DRAFT_1723543, partial [Trametes sanguinea]